MKSIWKFLRSLDWRVLFAVPVLSLLLGVANNLRVPKEQQVRWSGERPTIAIEEEVETEYTPVFVVATSMGGTPAGTDEYGQPTAATTKFYAETYGLDGAMTVVEFQKYAEGAGAAKKVVAPVADPGEDTAYPDSNGDGSGDPTTYDGGWYLMSTDAKGVVTLTALTATVDGYDTASAKLSAETSMSKATTLATAGATYYLLDGTTYVYSGATVGTFKSTDKAATVNTGKHDSKISTTPTVFFLYKTDTVKQLAAAFIPAAVTAETTTAADLYYISAFNGKVSEATDTLLATYEYEVYSMKGEKSTVTVTDSSAALVGKFAVIVTETQDSFYELETPGAGAAADVTVNKSGYVNVAFVHGDDPKAYSVNGVDYSSKDGATVYTVTDAVIVNLTEEDISTLEDLVKYDTYAATAMADKNNAVSVIFITAAENT